MPRLVLRMVFLTAVAAIVGMMCLAAIGLPKESSAVLAVVPVGVAVALFKYWPFRTKGGKDDAV